MNLYLLPGSPQNLAKSIYKSVPYSLIEQHLNKTVVDRIRHNLSGQVVPCWAFGAQGQSDYDNMDTDDVMLFKETGSTSFCVKGEYAYKIRSRELGKAIWGAPWEFIFFLNNVVHTSIPFARLRNALGYDDNYWLPGAIRVSENKFRNAMSAFKTFEKLMTYLETGKKDNDRTVIVRKAADKTRPIIIHTTHPASIINSSDQADDPWKI